MDVTVLTTEKQVDPDISLNVETYGFQIVSVPLPKIFSGLKGKYKKDSTSQSFNLLKSAFNYLRYRKGVFNACRMPDITDLWIKPAFKKALTLGHFDLIVSSCGPYSVHFVASKLKRQGLGKKWIADFRDLWSDNHLFKGLFPFNQIEKYYEKKILQHADAITTVSLPYAKPLIDKYGSGKVHIVENGFDKQDLANLPKIPIFFDDGKFRLVYTGSFYPQNQNVAPLFEAIKAIKDKYKTKHLIEKLEVVFVGPSSQPLNNLIKKYNLKANIKHFGFVSRETSLRMQRDAHGLIFIPDKKCDGVYTGKLFEYLYSKTPIIAIGTKNLEAAQKLILDAKAGRVLSTPREIKSYLIEKLKKPTKEKVEVSKDILERFSRKKLAEKFLRIVHVK